LVLDVPEYSNGRGSKNTRVPEYTHIAIFLKRVRKMEDKSLVTSKTSNAFSINSEMKRKPTENQKVHSKKEDPAPQ